MTRLTEATYRIEVLHRVSGRRVAGCFFTSGNITANFNRVFNAKSTASLVLLNSNSGGLCTGCTPNGCPCIPKKRKHELAFYRNDEKDPVWIGPVTGTTVDGTNGALTIRAEDRTYWWEGAPAQRGIVGNYTIDELFRRYTDQAEEYQPSGLQRRDGAVTASPNDLNVNVGAGDELYGEILSLAKTLMVFTVVGNQVYYGAPALPMKDGPAIKASRSLAGDGQITVDEDGTNILTRVNFIGANGVTSSYPPVEVDLGYGKRTSFEADTNVDDQDEADARSKAIFDQNTEPQTFLVTGGNSLSPSFPGTLKTLVPGRFFPVEADSGCAITPAERRRLNFVSVNIEATEANGWQLEEKRVAVDFSSPDTLGTAQAVSV